MSETWGLEGGYRRLLRWYPAWYRGQHEEEMLGVLMSAAQPGQRRPGVRESADLLWSAARIRVRTVLRGADSKPWADALTLFAVLLPLLMVVLTLTELFIRGAEYGFGSPADILTGAYGDPGAYAQSFRLNPFSAALAGSATNVLTAGPLPALVLAALVGLGLRRTAAAVAACVPLAYLAIALTNSYTITGNPRTDGTLYAYGLESLVLLVSTGSSPGWKALRWRPGVLLAVGAAALGAAVNGGFWQLVTIPALTRRSTIPLNLIHRYTPPGFLDRLFGVGLEGWGDWMLAQGALVALMVAIIVTMMVSSPVNRRVLVLLAIPFALECIMYGCSLANPSAPIGNTAATVPLLLILIAALVWLRVRHTNPAGSGFRRGPGGKGPHGSV